jgi:hypothetical protein
MEEFSELHTDLVSRSIKLEQAAQPGIRSDFILSALNRPL